MHAGVAEHGTIRYASNLGGMVAKQYWLMKTEPSEFSMDDLERKGREGWDGVRNYQARNFMRDQMKKGDEVLIYHSNARPSGVAGLASVCREAYPDDTAWDPENPHFDQRSTPESPIWVRVDVAFKKRFDSVVSLEAIKQNPKLKEMMLCRKGCRLSIQPVTLAHFEEIVTMAESA